MIKIKKQIKTDQENKAYHSMEEANPKTNLRIKRTTSDVMWLYTIFWNIISIQSCCRFVRVSQVELGLYCIHRVQVGTKIGPKIGLKYSKNSLTLHPNILRTKTAKNIIFFVRKLVFSSFFSILQNKKKN